MEWIVQNVAMSGARVIKVPFLPRRDPDPDIAALNSTCRYLLQHVPSWRGLFQDCAARSPRDDAARTKGRWAKQQSVFNSKWNEVDYGDEEPGWIISVRKRSVDRPEILDARRRTGQPPCDPRTVRNRTQMKYVRRQRRWVVKQRRSIMLQMKAKNTSS